MPRLFAARPGRPPSDFAVAAERMAAALGVPRASVDQDRSEPVDGWVPGPETGSGPVRRVAESPAPAEPVRWPSTLRGGWVDLGRPGLVALAFVALVAAAGAGLLAWRSRPVALPAPSPAPVPASTPAAASPSPAPSTAPSTGGPGVVVHVAGKVRRPGVVTLPSGARVADALHAAGGLQPGTDPGLLNLARRVVDGEQIVAGASAGPAAVPPGGGGAGGAVASGASPGVIDLNTASVTELDALPGVGPVLAQRIVDWRTRHGPFRDVGQLREVDGIGEQRYQDLRDRVRV